MSVHLQGGTLVRDSARRLLPSATALIAGEAPAGLITGQSWMRDRGSVQFRDKNCLPKLNNSTTVTEYVQENPARR